MPPNLVRDSYPNCVPIHTLTHSLSQTPNCHHVTHTRTCTHTHSLSLLHTPNCLPIDTLTHTLSRSLTHSLLHRHWKTKSNVWPTSKLPPNKLASPQWEKKDRSFVHNVPQKWQKSIVKYVPHITVNLVVKSSINDHHGMPIRLSNWRT